MVWLCLPYRPTVRQENQMSRKPRSSAWNDYILKTSYKHAKEAFAEKDSKADQLARDLQSLEEMQKKRPGKPPGRR